MSWNTASNKRKSQKRQPNRRSIDQLRPSTWQSVKRTVYRTPQDIINEIGRRSADGRKVEEEIVYAARHHWILLMRNLITPLLFILGCFVVAYYRAIGGQFLAMNAGTAGDFDFVNVILAIGVVLSVLVWFFSWFGTSKKRNTYQIWLGVGVVLLATLYFRLNGGRVFYTGNGVSNADGIVFDGLGIVLGMLIFGGMMAAIYAIFDWMNDFLILTKDRVIYDDEKLFVRRVQNQIALEDVKSVKSRTGETNSFRGYVQYYLKFGTIEVQSASFRQPITFEAANNPKEMQRQIENTSKDHKKRQSRNDIAQIVQTKIINPSHQLADKTAASVANTQTSRFLGRLFPENPKRFPDGTIEWRRHWVFAILELARPFGIFLLAVVALVVAARLDIVSPGWIGLVVLLGIIGFVAWGAWVVEDYTNDRYVLTKNQVIDVEKVPFGPEDRRSANLASLQNVQLKTSFWGRLIGYGDVELETAGGTAASKLTFYGVPKPQKVVGLINEYVDSLKRGERARVLDDTISLMAELYLQMQQPQQPPNPEAEKS